MTRHDMEQRADALMGSGYNCAETLLRVAREQLGLGPDILTSRVATCFGGGLGRCRKELCGALAGGVMAIGLAYGREGPKDPADRACDLAAAFRERFIARHGSSNCGVLLERFGRQENWSACKRLVAETAGILHDLLREPVAEAGSASSYRFPFKTEERKEPSLRYGSSFLDHH